MAFYLYNPVTKSKEYISSSYIRNQLLGFGSQLDEDVNDMSFYEHTIFKKLKFQPKVVSTEDLIERICDNIDISTNYLHYSLASMERVHVLALAYLLHENHISEIISILKSSNVETRSDIILNYLTKEDNRLDVFKPLKDYLNRINIERTNTTIPKEYNSKNMLMTVPIPEETIILQISYRDRFKPEYKYTGLPDWRREIKFEQNWWLTAAMIAAIVAAWLDPVHFSMGWNLMSPIPIDPGTYTLCTTLMLSNELHLFQFGNGKEDLTNDNIILNLKNVLEKYKSYGYAHYLKFLYENRNKLGTDTINLRDKLANELHSIFTQVLGEEISNKIKSLNSDINKVENEVKINDGKTLDTILLLTNRSHFFDTKLSGEIEKDNLLLNYSITDYMDPNFKYNTNCDKYFKSDISKLINLPEDRLFGDNTDDDISNITLSRQIFANNIDSISRSNHNAISSPNVSDKILQRELCELTAKIQEKKVILNNTEVSANELEDILSMSLVDDINSVISDVIASNKSKIVSFNVDVSDNIDEIREWVIQRKEYITNYFFIKNKDNVFELNENNILIKDRQHCIVRVLMVYEILIDYLNYIIDDSRTSPNIYLSENFMKWYKIMYLLRLSMYSEVDDINGTSARHSIYELKGMPSFSTLSSGVITVFNNLFVFDAIYKAITPEVHEYLDAAEKFFLNTTIENYYYLMTKKNYMTDIKYYTDTLT